MVVGALVAGVVLILAGIGWHQSKVLLKARSDIGTFYLLGGNASGGHLYWYRGSDTNIFDQGRVDVVLEQLGNLGSITEEGGLFALSTHAYRPVVYGVVTAENGKNTVLATSTDTLHDVSLSADKNYVAYTKSVTNGESTVLVINRATGAVRELATGYAGFFYDATHVMVFTPSGIHAIDVVSGEKNTLLETPLAEAPRVYQSATQSHFVWVTGTHVTIAALENGSLTVLGSFTGKKDAQYGIINERVYELFVSQGKLHVFVRTLSGMPIALPFSIASGALRDLANVRQ